MFNYRRVPVSDPVQGRFRTDDVGATIVSVVSTLLEHGKPVYYVEAGNTFLPDLFDTLQANFASESRIVDGVTMYKLSLAPSP